MSKPLAYETVAERFMNFKCKLLTTKEEYEGGKMNACSKFLVKMPCGHNRDTYYRNIVENPELVCKECTRKRSQAEIYYKRAVKRYAAFNCKMLTTIKEFIEGNMNILDAFTYEASCGHVNVGAFKNFEKNPDALCKECMKKEKYDKYRLPYAEVKERFENNGCELLTTEKEYYEKGMTYYDFHRFIASCGHERTCSMATWNGNDITLCSECTFERMRLNAQEDGCKIDGNPRGNVIEHEAFVFIKTLLENKFQVKKLREGTLADFLIKPTYIIEDIWLAIQLKATRKEKLKKGYCFSFGKSDYTGLLILCVCMKDNKAWVFDGKISKDVCGIGITEGSKYHKGKVELADLPHQLEDYYANSPLTTFDKANIPVSPSHQVEHAHQVLRDTKIGYMFDFEYPELEGQVFDFKINGYKIQDKSGYNRIGTRIPTMDTHLTKHGGVVMVSYDENDNDFYWISCPDKDTFYIFPESILIEKGYISTKAIPSVRKSITLHWEANTSEDLVSCTSNDEWSFPFRYKYSNLDISKLKSVFV